MPDEQDQQADLPLFSQWVVEINLEKGTTEQQCKVKILSARAQNSITEAFLTDAEIADDAQARILLMAKESAIFILGKGGLGVVSDHKWSITLGGHRNPNNDPALSQEPLPVPDFVNISIACMDGYDDPGDASASNSGG